MARSREEWILRRILGGARLCDIVAFVIVSLTNVPFVGAFLVPGLHANAII